MSFILYEIYDLYSLMVYQQWVNRILIMWVNNNVDFKCQGLHVSNHQAKASIKASNKYANDMGGW